jgi:hypothetical protein
MFAGQSTVLGGAQLWRSMAPTKCRFFMWTLLLGKCWTTERRRWHILCSSVECGLCSQEEETIIHLFLQCTFSREVWFQVLSRYSWAPLVPGPNDGLIEWWLATRKRVFKPRRKTFDSMFERRKAFDSMTIGVFFMWSLWLQQNDRAFGRASMDALAVDS